MECLNPRQLWGESYQVDRDTLQGGLLPALEQWLPQKGDAAAVACATFTLKEIGWQRFVECYRMAIDTSTQRIQVQSKGRYNTVLLQPGMLL